jgi:6-phospho-beta-glucosidase
MKITIIGGAGVRVPLLVNGLMQSDLPIADITLFDLDLERQNVIGRLTTRFAGGARVRASTDLAEAVEGADYVFISIRVGGIQGRARDEAIALAHGLVGQETIGPGGFAMAVRTIPAVVSYATEVARRAPHAWIVNFTNPVGIVTQAVRQATGARIIGICDTPTELFEDVAHALDLPSAECYFDYVGLNHLGWVREVYHRGVPQLARLWDRPDLLGKIYRAPLFEVERLQGLRLLPTEYVYYYYRADDAFANITRAGESRGAVVDRLNTQLFCDLEDTARDPVVTYEQYLAERNASYMQIESGAAAPLERSPWAELTGYDKIALQTVRGIHFNLGTIVPLNVENRGNLPELESGDVIEAPCVVNANGALPLHVGPAPATVRDLLVRVKDYERRTVKAGLTQARADAIDALASNPLIASPAQAAALVAALAPA